MGDIPAERQSLFKSTMVELPRNASDQELLAMLENWSSNRHPYKEKRAAMVAEARRNAANLHWESRLETAIWGIQQYAEGFEGRQDRYINEDVDTEMAVDTNMHDDTENIVDNVNKQVDDAEIKRDGDNKNTTIDDDKKDTNEAKK